MRAGISTSVIQRGQGGVGQYVLALVRAFMPLARDHSFTLFVLEEDLPRFAFAEGVMQLHPVPEHHRKPVRNILWHQAVLPGLARTLGLDVVHVPSYRRLMFRCPCARVATIHDLAPFHVSNKYDPLRMFYGRTVVRRLAARQEEVIAVSHATAEDLRRHFGLPSSRISVVYNGLDHERFSPGLPDVERAEISRRIGNERPFFLYTSRLEHPGKNHVRLIEAFNRFRRAGTHDHSLVLAGRDWHGAETIHDVADQSPFHRDIHFLGFVPDGDLPLWYRAAEALVYPSLHEGFGMPPLEAMACGCPVIASTAGALSEVCGGAAETIDPNDVDDITRSLRRVATDEFLRRRLKAAGLARAQGFDWRNTAAATLEVYERAIARYRHDL